MQNRPKTDAARLALFVFLPLALSVFLHSLVLTPIYLRLANDVVWNETVLPPFIGYLELFLEYGFYWLIFAFFGEAASQKRILFAILAVLAILVLRQVLELVMGYSVMGFPSAETFFREELTYLLLQLLFDCVLSALAILVIYRVGRPKARAFLLACLPFAVQVVSLCIMLANARPLTGAVWREAALDLIVHIVCLAAGFGVIFFLDRQLGKETPT